MAYVYIPGVGLIGSSSGSEIYIPGVGLRPTAPSSGSGIYIPDEPVAE